MLPMCNHSLIIVCSRLQLNLCVSHILLTMADQAHPEIDQVAELAQEPAEGDDGEAALKVTAKEVPAFELEYNLGGTQHTRPMFGDIKHIAGLSFVALHGSEMSKWVQQMADLKAGKTPCFNCGLTHLLGLTAMRDARNLQTDRLLCGWGADRLPGNRPSPYQRQTASKNGGVFPDDLIVKLRRCSKTIQVLPRTKSVRLGTSLCLLQ